MENMDLLSIVFEHLPDGLVILDKNNDIVFINSMAEKLRHTSRAEKIGRNVLDCHPQHSQEKVKKALLHLKKDEAAVFKRMIIDRESNRIFENSYKTILDGNGEVAATFVNIRDITEKHKSEQSEFLSQQALHEQVLDLNEKLNSLFLSSLTCIVNTLEAKDPYTKGHSIRVTDISKTFVELSIGQMQLLHDVEIAGKLHDVGKIGIREAILTKPGKLTEEEFMQMRMHPLIAEQILSPIIKLKDIVAIAKHHHERYDGKGYPDGLRAEDIPIGARVLALADTFDAMTSTRPYKPCSTAEEAILEMRKHLGTQFDPELGKRFVDLVDSGAIG
jgi:PAS domain S-box-containing protein